MSTEDSQIPFFILSLFTSLAEVFTPAQMIVLAFVTMIYVPCVATFVMFKKEFGGKTTLYITVFEVAFAAALGGAFFRLLGVFNIA